MQFLNDVDADAAEAAVRPHSIDIACCGADCLAVLNAGVARAEHVLPKWVTLCMREAAGCGEPPISMSIEPVGVARMVTQVLSLHQPGGNVQYYMTLQCFDCAEYDETELHPWPDCCYAEARDLLKWGKPNNKPWSHVRCPDCWWGPGRITGSHWAG